MAEQMVGKVFNYYAKPGVAAIAVAAGTIKVGDRIRISGRTTELETVVKSMQEERSEINEAGPGHKVGIKVPERTREGDMVYKVD